jgi:uracil-DNA glycosylase family protein
MAAPFPTAAAFLPKRPFTFDKLLAAARGCRGCDLYQHATQTVFGEGPHKARVVVLGQQPGDHEDREGHPFVGPAGHLLDKALADAQLDRGEIYISNVVKHFKFKGKGNFRFHQKPTGLEIRACRPWLEAELDLVRPEVVVTLGVDASEWVLGHKVTIKKERGRLQPSPFGNQLLVTAHPSSILRMPDQTARHVAYRELVRDLRIISADG